MRVIISIAVCLLQIWMAQAQTTGPAKGALVIVGGNDKAQLCFKEFLKLAGGTDAKIVIVTTASSSSKSFDYINHSQVKVAREILGLTNVMALHTHDPAKADTKEFIKPFSSHYIYYVMYRR